MPERSLRCAVYTRKSSEEGLEQDFNSLHAQIFALSEPLDWVQPWVAPSYRIGP